MLDKNKNKKQNPITIFLLIPISMGIFLWPQTAWLSTITPENIINLTNRERQKQDLPPLTANQLLTKAAYKKGQTILDNQIFQHNFNGRKFSAWIKETGYNYAYVGENLAIDFITSEGVIKAWLNSPTHRRNLLNKNFQEIGVAVLNGWFKDKNTTLIVQIFGQPLTVNTITLQSPSQFAGTHEIIKTAKSSPAPITTKAQSWKNYALSFFNYSPLFPPYTLPIGLNLFSAKLTNILKNNFSFLLPTTFNFLTLLFYFTFVLTLLANLKISSVKINQLKS